MGHLPRPEGQDEHPAGGNRQVRARDLGGSAFDVLTGEYTGSFVNIPVTYQFSDAFKANVNGGWIYERGNNRHLLTYGARRRVDSDEALHDDRRGVRRRRRGEPDEAPPSRASRPGCA